MRVEIKFCGLTRAEDAAQVGALGGSYAGVIFAGGPRRLDRARACDVLAAVSPGVRRVGVFSTQTTEEIAELAQALGLDVVQLHGDPSADAIATVRALARTAVWAVTRVRGPESAAHIRELDAVADAVVLDSFVPGREGGTGVPFDWTLIPHSARPQRARLVAAGGLTADNVGAALRTLHPDVVDVSSGVERAPGIKDHARMRAFADAVRAHHEEP